MNRISVFGGTVHKKARQYLPASQFGRNVALIASSSLLGQLLVLAISPLLTRIYSPTDFGILAVYMAIVTTMLPVVSMRYDAAIPLPRNDADATDLLVLSLLIAFGTSAVVGVVAFVFGEQFVDLVRAPQLHPYLWLVPLSLFAAGLYQILSSWALRLGAFKAVARTRIFQGFAQSVVQVAFGVLGSGPVGLLAGDAVGRASGVGTLYSASRDKVTFTEIPGKQRLLAVARRYRDFPFYSTGSAFLNTLGLQLPVLLFAGLFGPQVAGWMILAQRVVSVPLRLAGHAIGQVYTSEAARLARTQPHSVQRIFTRLAQRLFFISVPAVAAVGVLAPVAFPLVFGASWREAGLYVLLLVPMSIGQFVVSPLSQSTIITERQGAQLFADAVRVIAALASIVVPYYAGLSHFWAVGAYSAVMALTYIGYFIMYRHVIHTANAALTERVQNNE